MPVYQYEGQHFDLPEGLSNEQAISKIEAYLQEYNKNHNYTYIVSYEQGLFYYKDSVNNITADLIKGLNERYKPSSK